MGDYFDWIILLNARLVAAGSAQAVLTAENLNKTYGGRLSLLSEITEKLYRSHLDRVHDYE